MTAPAAPVPASLVLQFHGYVLIRLPTDPDPPDEPRGVSGYTFAFAGEPDLDRVLRMQPPADFTPRSYTPPLGVTVYAANKVAGDLLTPVPALMGAKVQLMGKPRFENRNWTLTLPGFEPVYPFDLQVAGNGLSLRRSAPFDPTQPDLPLMETPEALLLAHGARGMEYEPETVGRATGIWDSHGTAQQRLAQLTADLDKEPDKGSARAANLSGRIAELTVGVANPKDRRTFARYFVERFAFSMEGADAAVTGAPASWLGPLDTKDPWLVSYWLGGWDPDLLCAFFEGSLQVPYTPTANPA